MKRFATAALLMLACGSPRPHPAAEHPAAPVATDEHLRSSVGVTASASSHATSGGAEWSADAIVNDVLDRGWCEGVPGPGVGEGVTLRLSRPIEIHEVVVTLRPEPDIGEPHDLPSAIEVVIPGRAPIRADHAEGEGRYPELHAGVDGGPISELTIRIAEVAARQHEDTCLSELDLVGAAGKWSLWVGLGEEDRAEVAALVLAARQAFATCDRAALESVIAAPFTVRFGQPGTPEAELREGLTVDDVRSLCTAGKLRLPAPPGPIEAREYTGHYIAFRYDDASHDQTWTVRRVDGHWRFDLADVH